jgi:hypothetical protein
VALRAAVLAALPVSAVLVYGPRPCPGRTRLADAFAAVFAAVDEPDTARQVRAEANSVLDEV